MIISDERIAELLDLEIDRELGILHSDVGKAIRTAILETAEACAKICDDYAELLSKSSAQSAEIQIVVAHQCERLIRKAAA